MSTTPAQQVLSRAAEWGRAPSAHNTQPWRVSAQNSTTLLLGWQADRVLTVGDPTRRDLFLSLGCLAESLRIVAADQGYAVHPTWAVDRGARVVGRMELREAPEDDLEASADAPGVRADDAGFTVAELLARRTARSGYAEPPVSAAQVADLVTAAGVSSGADLGLSVLPPDLVETQLNRADRWTFDGPTTDELRAWLRLDRHDPAYTQDGLSDAALGLAGWERVGLSVALRPRVLPLLRRTGLTAVLGRTATARPLGTVVALTAAPDLPDEDLVTLGGALLRVWLAAGRQGLHTHPLSQLLDCPDTAPHVQAAVGPNATAYAVFRLGHPTTPPARSHRLTDTDPTPTPTGRMGA